MRLLLLYSLLIFNYNGYSQSLNPEGKIFTLTADNDESIWITKIDSTIYFSFYPYFLDEYILYFKNRKKNIKGNKMSKKFIRNYCVSSDDKSCTSYFNDLGSKYFNLKKVDSTFYIDSSYDKERKFGTSFDLNLDSLKGVSLPIADNEVMTDNYLSYFLGNEEVAYKDMIYNCFKVKYEKNFPILSTNYIVYFEKETFIPLRIDLNYKKTTFSFFINKVEKAPEWLENDDDINYFDPFVNQDLINDYFIYLLKNNKSGYRSFSNLYLF